MNALCDKKFLNALLLIPGVGYQTIAKFREYFQSYESAWRANQKELSRTDVEVKIRAAFINMRDRIDPDSAMGSLVRHGITLLEPTEPGFPRLLKEIPSPPQWLYIKGRLPAEEHSVAIVGARKATSYGREATERIISSLAGIKGVTIVSGLAIGIDSQAHLAALKHNIRTVAVLGSGLDETSLFPPKNIRLAREIVERGWAVISEYPIGMPAFKQNFIQRNRLISGLAKGTLVVEAGERSGALITARYALEQNRSVMAVPGSIFSPYSAGTNTLIREGATPVTSAEDILEELGISYTRDEGRSDEEHFEKTEKVLLSLLDEPSSIDVIKDKTKLEAAVIITSLSTLELRGRVKNLGGGKWIRA